MTTYADDGLVAGSHLLGLLARLDCAGGLASTAFLNSSFTAAPTSIGDLDPPSVRLAPGISARGDPDHWLHLSHQTLASCHVPRPSGCPPGGRRSRRVE